MKILLLAFEYPPIVGGGSTYNKNLAKALIKQGAEVCVVTGGKTDQTTLSNKVRVERYKCFSEGNRGNLNIYDGLDILIKTIKQFKPDIIHTLHYTENLLAQIANINFQIPLVSTLNRTPDPPTRRIIQNGKWSLYDFVSNRFTDHIIMISEFTRKRFLETSMGVLPSNITVIYPGIDQKEFDLKRNNNEILSFRRKLGISKKDILILAPTVIRKRKGINFLCKSIHMFTKQTDKGVKLIITGVNSGDKNTINELKKLLGKDNLVIHNKFEDEEMPMLYKSSDLMILPSQSEGLGIVLIEAMMCKCPIIASNIPGINEVITNYYNGELVKFGDYSAMVNAINKVLTSERIKSKYTNNGFTTVRKKFNLELQGKKHMKIYKILIDQKKLTICSVPFFRNKNVVNVLLRKNEGKYKLIRSPLLKGETIMDTSIENLRRITGLNVDQPYYHFLMDNSNQHVYVYEIESWKEIKSKLNWVSVKYADRLLSSEERTIVKYINTLLPWENKK